MKKIIALVLAALMVLSLCGCGSTVSQETLDEILETVQRIDEKLGSDEEAAPAEEAAEAEEAAADDTVMVIPPVQTGAHLADILLSACGFEGYDFTYGETYYDTITAVNTVGFEQTWSQGDDNPAAEYKAEAMGDSAAADTDKQTVDFTWNGQMEVWSILPTTGAEGLVMINDAMGSIMETQGFTYVKKDAQGDPTAQVQFVEDAIAAGNVGCLMIAAMSVELLQDVVIEALENGIAVAYLGAEPTAYGISGCVYTAYEITGMYAVQAALDWAENSGADIPQVDGKYEIAIDTYYDIADGAYRSTAMKGTIEDSDSLTLVAETSSYGDSAYTDAYNNATDVLGANPDCHLFIAYEPEEAMGAADAIKDYCDVNGLDVANYCVIPCYAEDTTFTEMYEASVADASANAIKGYATYGDPAVTAADAETLYGPSYEGIMNYVNG